MNWFSPFLLHYKFHIELWNNGNDNCIDNDSKNSDSDDKSKKHLTCTYQVWGDPLVLSH